MFITSCSVSLHLIYTINKISFLCSWHIAFNLFSLFSQFSLLPVIVSFFPISFFPLSFSSFSHYFLYLCTHFPFYFFLFIFPSLFFVDLSSENYFPHLLTVTFNNLKKIICSMVKQNSSYKYIASPSDSKNRNRAFQK